jgi:hypothetical protein
MVAENLRHQIETIPDRWSARIPPVLASLNMKPGRISNTGLTGPRLLWTRLRKTAGTGMVFLPLEVLVGRDRPGQNRSGEQAFFAFDGFERGMFWVTSSVPR